MTKDTTPKLGLLEMSRPSCVCVGHQPQELLELG